MIIRATVRNDHKTENYQQRKNEIPNQDIKYTNIFKAYCYWIGIIERTQGKIFWSS